MQTTHSTRAESGALRISGLGAIGVIIACTIVAYIPAFRAGFIWDDDYYVTNNEALRTFTGLKSIWSTLDTTPQYYPMVFTSFWIEYHVWGLSPAGYHSVNVLLHAANAVLLLLLLQRLKIPGALLIAMLFALHPVHVESVAWITERKNVLSLFFYLLSFHSYASFAEWEEAPSPRRRKAALYLLALITFLFALFSKTVTCSLPAAILLVIYWKKGSISYRDILPLAPFFAAGLVMAGITARVEHDHVGSVHLDFGLDWLDRVRLAGRALCFYAWKLMWPNPLMFIYPRWDAKATVAMWVFPCAVVTALLVLFLLRRRIGRGPLVCVLFFAGSLFPALGFVDVYPMRFSWVADHFQYMASIGLLVLIGGAISRIVGTSRKLWILAVPALCIPLAILTWNQCRVYLDLQTLWRDTLSKNPQAWIAQTNLAIILVNRNENLDEAQSLLEKALRLNPQNFEALTTLGTIYRKRGDLRKSGELWQEAVERGLGYIEVGYRGNPEGMRILCEIADNLSKSGRNRVAIMYYQAALRNDPGFSKASYNLAALLISENRPQEAVPVARNLMERQPNNPDASNMLGLALREAGQKREALAHFEQAVRKNPNVAELHFNLAQTYADLGDPARAIHEYNEVLRLNPSDEEARTKLSVELKKLPGPNE